MPLWPEARYTAAVTAAGPGCERVTEETSFTTMAALDRRTATGLYLFDGEVYGVAMPVMVEFVQPVRGGPGRHKRRIFVTTDPHQPRVCTG